MEKKKRETWETEETRYFLTLMRERQIMKSLDGKRFRADEIFKYLESPMNEKGYNKSSKQMQTRFRTLRLQYNKIRREMGKSGSGNCMSSFSYAVEMDQLLEFRPVATRDAVDSTPLQDFSESNENSYSSDRIYEDEPDIRDGAVPGTSTSDNNSSTTDCLLQEDSSCESNTMKQSTVSAIPTKKRKLNRSYEAITLRYADKLKENYEQVQSKVMADNRSFMEELIKYQQQSEKEIINNMLKSQRNILSETTNQLLVGLQNIFSSKASSQVSTVSVPTVNSIVQSPFVISSGHSSSGYSSSFSPPNFESQAFRSSNSFPKVLLNLKSPTPERATTASPQQTITVRKYPQAENEKCIPVRSLLNVTLQDSQNSKFSNTQDSLQFQNIQDFDEM